MQSNSKLSRFEKSVLKDFCKLNPHVCFATMGETTLAFARVGNLVEFSTAICAPTEKKMRPKVGKYWAITRYENGQTTKMPVYQFDNMLENEGTLAIWE
jgi:hypothetical protein